MTPFKELSLYEIAELTQEEMDRHEAFAIASAGLLPLGPEPEPRKAPETPRKKTFVTVSLNGHELFATRDKTEAGEFAEGLEDFLKDAVRPKEDGITAYDHRLGYPHKVFEPQDYAVKMSTEEALLPGDRDKHLDVKQELDAVTARNEHSRKEREEQEEAIRKITGPMRERRLEAAEIIEEWNDRARVWHQYVHIANEDTKVALSFYKRRYATAEILAVAEHMLRDQDHTLHNAVADVRENAEAEAEAEVADVAAE